MRSLFILTPLAIVLTASSASASVLWRGDFETGDTSQWSKAQAIPGRLQVVSSPVREGKHALRVEVRQGDDPIGASGNRNELVYSKVLEKEGNDRWYAWSTRWDPSFPSVKTWQLFVQWHHTGSSGSPPLELYVYGEELRLRVDASTDVWKGTLSRGEWHDFVLHVKWSSDPKVGFVELWYDGAKALAKTHGRTLFAGQENYLKMGLYRNASIAPVGILFHDGMTIATDAADVMGSAGDAGTDGGEDAGGDEDAAVSDADPTADATGPLDAAAEDAVSATDGASEASAAPLEDDAASGASCAAARPKASGQPVALGLLGMLAAFVRRTRRRRPRAR